MAKTFFSFDTSINNGDLSDNRLDDYDGNEEEYDARNDETFGGDLPSSDDDWEQQHEQFAEIEENTKHSEELENQLSQLVLDDSDSDNDATNNGSLTIAEIEKVLDEINFPDLLSRFKYRPRKPFVDRVSSSSSSNRGDARKTSSIPPPAPPVTLPPTQICTVEELERNLLKNKQQQQQQQQKPVLPTFLPQPYHHPFFPPRPPPGLHPMPPHLPPHMMRMMPPPPPHYRPYPPGFMHPNNGQFPVNHPFNFPPPPQPPPPRSMMMPNSNQSALRHFPHHQQQRIRHDSGGGGGGYRHKQVYEQNRDEYAGLMTNREKQWLLNIQLLQLNTGTPYFDDYYYTMYKERKTANNNNNNGDNHKKSQFQRRDRNNERQDNQNVLTPRVYTPLQFENSLGKLQCGSVTAPRKIIDMDIVSPDKDGENVATSRDTRKSKQILLELEAMYTLFLKAIDLKHPLALYDMDKLREMKQKQRLKELEAAQTAEQKQEVLTLLREESRPIVEDQNDYFVKIVKNLLQEEKFNSFFNFSKGKMLVIRLLPYLSPQTFHVQLKELWLKILLSLPIVAKRDTLGDNILPKFYPYFKAHLDSYDFSNILELSSNLTETVKQDNVRSTPIAVRGKPRLHFVLSNKFGISAVAALIQKSEHLLGTNETISESEKNKWCDFLQNLTEILASLKDVPTPQEKLQKHLLQDHLKRFDVLSGENKILLENVFAFCSD